VICPRALPNISACQRTGLFEFLRVHHVSLVAQEFALEFPDQVQDWFAVIVVSGADEDIHQLAHMLDHQVQLEAIEPARRGFSPARKTLEDLMTGNP